MSQCSACGSFNEEGAVFCSQCGGSMRASKPPLRKRRSLRILLILGAVQLLLLAGVLIVLFYPESEAPENAGRGNSADEVVAVARRRKPDAAGSRAGVVRDDGSEERPEDEAPSQPLALGELGRLVERSLVVLELSDADGRHMRDVRGVVVRDSEDPPDESSEGLGAAVILTRFEHLLGANTMRCRHGLLERTPRLDVAGVIAFDVDRDLALVQVEPAEFRLPALPIALELPQVSEDELDIELVVFSGQRPRLARVDNLFHRSLDGHVGILLADEPRVAPESFLCIDRSGQVVGLCRLQTDGFLARRAPGAERSRSEGSVTQVFVDPSLELAASVGGVVSWTPFELTRRFFEGTFRDLRERGLRAFREKSWSSAIELLAQALDRARVEAIEGELLDSTVAALRESYLAEATRLLGAGRTAEAEAIVEEGLGWFQDDSALWVLLGDARSSAGSVPPALAAWLQARELDPGEALDRRLEDGYLQHAGELRAAGDLPSVEVALIEGIESLPKSGRLRLELGRLYDSWEAWDDAIRQLEEAKRLDRGLTTQVDILLERIDRILKQRDALIIPIPAGSSTIRTSVTVDGRQEAPFIIDTGATYTALPERLATQLGYDLRRAETVRVTTAAGSLEVPKIQLRSIDVGGYTVRNLQAIVLPASVGDVSLLGLNYLKFFRYAVDSKRGEFRLERQ